MSSLTIVIPVYNEEDHLKDCLDSIAAQTVPPDEVIVADNNSTDKTAQIAKSYNFVRLLKEPKQGVVYARNRGFNAARSDIIGRIDADTILPKNWVARVKNFYAIDDNKSHALTGGGQFYNVRLPRFSSWLQDQIAFRINRFIMGHYILFGANMALPTKVWHKVRKSVCGRNDLHEDLDLAIHLHRFGVPITYKEGLKVGVKMRRVRSRQRELWNNLMLWPTTLRVHNNKLWPLGWIGAVLLFLSAPVVVVAEHLARAIGRPGLSE